MKIHMNLTRMNRYLLLIQQTMKRLKSLSVDRISILTTDHEPAVPKAGLGFSILKFFKREKPNTDRMNLIIQKLAEPATAKRIDAIIEKLEKLSKRC